MITVHQFKNEIRFLKDGEVLDLKDGDRMATSRCEQEPRLTLVTIRRSTGATESFYAVDDVRVEDQTADGVVAALAMSNARAM